LLELLILEINLFLSLVAILPFAKSLDNQLNRSLCGASYYLNLILHYDAEYKADYELKHGMYDCLGRLVWDIYEISKIDAHIESFKSKYGFFGTPIAQQALNQNFITMVESYGDELPKLQRIAIRVLSLTSSLFRCNCNWSAFERVRIPMKFTFYEIIL